MSLDYVQKQYYWIPRTWGADPEIGAYASFAAGGWQWVSDQDPNTIPTNPVQGLQQRALHLPAWFPRKSYLSGVEVALYTNDTPGLWNELSGWIDPTGQFFHGGTPNGNEGGANFTNAISLFHVTFQGQSAQKWHRDFPKPILVDRDAGDLIEVKGGFNLNIAIVFIGFRFLVPNPNPTLP